MDERQLKDAVDDQNVDIVPYTKRDRFMTGLILIFVIANFVAIIAQLVGVAW